MTFSLSAASPLYPSLMPRLVDPLWFKSDVPQDENVELSKVEKEHSDWLKSIGEKEIGFPPIGKHKLQKLYEHITILPHILSTGFHVSSSYNLEICAILGQANDLRLCFE